MEEKQNQEQELDTVYRWYELARYDGNVPEGEKGKIQSNLEETFSELLNSLKEMAKELGINGFDKLDIETARRECSKGEEKLSLMKYLEPIFEEYIKSESQKKIEDESFRKKVIDEKREKIEKKVREKAEKEGKSEEEIQTEINEGLEKEIKKEAKKEVCTNMANIAEKAISQGVHPQVKAYVQCYLDSFAEYGPGARDNVVTAMVISGGVQQKGEEGVYEPHSANALYGCGFGKTTVSKGVAMGKKDIGKRSVITSSTPELAGQSFDELTEGFAQRGMSVLYYSEGTVKILDKSGKVQGKDKPLTEEEIAKAFKEADVIISDLTALIRAKEAGLYEANRDRDSLLQDEQDSDMFHNLWSVEIKGEEYSDEIPKGKEKSEHQIRIDARKKADAEVQEFMTKEENKGRVTGNKVKQSVSVDNRPPKIEISGNSIIFEETSIEVPDGIEPIEFAEFIMDSLLARGLYTDKEKDYVVKDGRIESISPSTGGKNDIPEGVIQALAIKEGIGEIQPEKRVEKVVSKMTFLKESFAEVSGMSATYGMKPEEFLETVSEVGTSPELVEVMPLIKKKGRIPNFENLDKDEKNPTICKKDVEKETDLQVTISNGETIKCPSPHIAAIVRNIEAHKDEAIIIGTDDRQKTIEIVAALDKIYPGMVVGYSSVPDEKGDPKLLPPPNPAENEKLEIGVGKIVVGDHCIGRGVTPNKPNDQKTREDKNGNEIAGKKEHLIMAQMPSRSEGLLEQFLGRVGRKDEDGSVSFILQEDDAILEEFRQLNEGKEPDDILEVIESVYPEKTKDAKEATRGDIELGRQSYQHYIIIEAIIDAYNIEKFGEKENEKYITAESLENLPEEFTKRIRRALEYFDKTVNLKFKQFKGQNKEIDINVKNIIKEFLVREKELSEKRKDSFNRGDEAEQISLISEDSRYSDIKSIYERSVELSKLMGKMKENGNTTHADTNKDGR